MSKVITDEILQNINSAKEKEAIAALDRLAEAFKIKEAEREGARLRWKYSYYNPVNTLDKDITALIKNSIS